MIHPKFPHRFIFILSLCLVAFGLSTGKALMSIGMIALSANWLLEADFKSKWQLLRERKFLPLFFLLYFFTQLIWLSFDPDPSSAGHYLKMSLPFLAFPIVLGTKKIEKKEFYSILSCFLGGLLLSASVGFIKYFQGNFNDYRDLSVFISHIRLGLFLALGLGVIVYLWVKLKTNYRHLLVIPYIYLLIFVRILESGTGYLATGLVLFISLIYIIIKLKSRIIAITASVLFLLTVGFATYRISQEYKELTTPQAGVYDNLPVYTAQGNLYEHHPEITILENGYPVYLNYCPFELRKTWAQKSSIPLDSMDHKGQLLQGTLVRYLTSKGSKKDAEAVLALNDLEVEQIENGIASIVPPDNGWSGRVNEIFSEYIYFKNGMNPNGHSITQRFYYYQAGLSIWKNHFFFGTGKGVEMASYQDFYQFSKSELDMEHRLKAHNQMLSFLVSYGLIGSLLILFSFTLPIIGRKFNVLGWMFLAILLLGFLSDDILDRQAGVSFVSLFYCLLFIGTSSDSKRDDLVSHTIN